MRSKTSVASNGLVRKSFTPPAKARHFVSSLESAVSIRTGR